MKQFNKASAAAGSGLLATVVGVSLGLSPEIIGAVSTVLSTLLVYLVPNIMR